MPANKVYQRLLKALVEREEENEKFYKLLFGNIYNRLCAYYGSTRAMTIFQHLFNKYLCIINVEGFLTYKELLREVGTEFFKKPLTLETYLENVSLKCKSFYDLRYEQIRLTAFLVHVAYSYKLYNRLTLDDLKVHLRWFLLNISQEKFKSPFIFNVVTESEFFKIRNAYKLTVKYEVYLEVVVELKRLLKALSKEFPELELPKIEVTVPVAFKSRAKKEALIKKTFDLAYIPSKKLKRLLDTTDYEDYKPYLYFLKYRSTTGEEADIQKLLSHLKAIDDYDQLLSCTIDPILESEKFRKRYMFDYDLGDTREGLVWDIEVDCSTVKKEENLSILAQDAFALGAIRKGTMSRKKEAFEEGRIRITFRNVNPVKSFVDAIIEEKEKIRSLYMVEPIINIEFPSRCNTIDIDNSPEYIRIISDIHCDVNRGRNYHFDFGNDFVINCGDTSGDCINTEDWIKKNMNRGVFVTGNHLGYNQPYGIRDENHEYKNTIEGQMAYLEHAFEGSEVTYLNNKVTYFKGLTIIGTPLYTNFELFGTPNIQESMDYAMKGLNDYFYCTSYVTKKYTENERGMITSEPLEAPYITKTTPQIHRNMCFENLLFLMRELEKHKNEPVIVVTHHAPVKYSIHTRYRLDRLNPCFANNLNKIINKYPNIRMLVHGHTHDSFEYTVNGRTLVVCEPFGYYTEQQNLKKMLPKNYGKRYRIDDIFNPIKWQNYLSNLKNFDLVDK